MNRMSERHVQIPMVKNLKLYLFFININEKYFININKKFLQLPFLTLNAMIWSLDWLICRFWKRMIGMKADLMHISHGHLPVCWWFLYSFCSIYAWNLPHLRPHSHPHLSVLIGPCAPWNPRSWSFCRMATKRNLHQRPFSASMPSSNLNPTYLDTAWCLVDDWTIQYLVQRSGKGKRATWKTNLGQVRSAHFSTSSKEKKGCSKESIILFSMSTMEDDEPDLAFRISNMAMDRLPGALRTSLQGKSAPQIASTSLLVQRLHEMTLLFV